MSGENWIVLAVMACYLLFMLWVGRRASHHVADLNSYVLAGRNLPWYVLAMTFLATVASPVQLLGQPGFAYQFGFSLYFWEKIVVISVVVLLIVPLGRRLRGIDAATIADVARARFPGSRRIHYVLTIAQVIWGIFVAALSVFGGSLLITAVTGIPLTVALTVIVGLTVAYTILGGLRAVVVTDAAQWAIIIVGVAVFLPLLYVTVDPFTTLFSAHLGADGFSPAAGGPSLTAGFTDLYSLPSGIGSVLTAAAFLVTSGAMGVADPTFAQRMLAARSDREGRIGAYTFSVMYLLIAVLILTLGMYGRVLLPGLDQPDQVLVLIAQKYLPLFGKALFLTAVAAAAMSTISSYLNVTAGIFVKNIVLDRRPDMPAHRQVLWTRVGTAAVAATALLFAPVASGGLAVAAVAAQIILVGAVGPLIFLILFWRRLTERGAFWGFCLTTVVTFTLILAVGGPDAAVLGPGWFGIPVQFWAFAVAAIGFVGLSLVGRRAVALAPPRFREYFEGRGTPVRPSRLAVGGVCLMWAVLLAPLAYRELLADRTFALPPLGGSLAWMTDATLIGIALAVIAATVVMVRLLITYVRTNLVAGQQDRT